METQAMILKSFNEPLELSEVEVPALSDGQVLVRLAASGVCGSDVHIWRGEDKRAVLPMIPGHEGIGYIEEIKGQRLSVNGEPLKSGDYIIWNRGANCGRCYECQVLKEPSLCRNRVTYGINKPFEEPPHLNGCYARHIILSANTDIIKLSDDIDPIAMVSASCSGATMAHAFDMCKIRPGSSLVIQGPGPLGLFAVAFGRLLGAGPIAVIGGTASRLEICKKFGADIVLDRKALPLSARKEIILEATMGRGADIVIEAAGYPDAVAEGLDILATNGTYLSTGFAQFTGYSQVDFFSQVVKKNAVIKGVWVSDTSHLCDAINLISKDQALFKSMVTHTMSLNEANEALRLMASKEALKVVLTYEGV